MVSTFNENAEASISTEDENEFGQKKLRDLEELARAESRHSTLFLFLINGYAAFSVFFLHLISLETIFSALLSVSLTIVTYYKTEDKSGWDGSTMEWILLSFAIVTPMSASLGMAFTRRESALRYIAIIRSTLVELYGAHAVWDWSICGKENSGRIGSILNWCEHSDNVLNEIFGIGEDLERFLTLPNAGRARHRMTRLGRNEACDLLKVSQGLADSLMLRIGRLTLYTEVLKHEGLPPNEATRVRQWERDVTMNCDLLRIIKTYRTPQALRSLCRIFSVFLPPFYAPYYASMAQDTNSLGLGIAFSILTSVALTALFESLSQMEDPFVGHLTLDGIDCCNELRVIYRKQLLNMRALYFQNAPSFEQHISKVCRTQRTSGREFGRPRLFDEGH